MRSSIFPAESQFDSIAAARNQILFGSAMRQIPYHKEILDKDSASHQQHGSGATFKSLDRVGCAALAASAGHFYDTPLVHVLLRRLKAVIRSQQVEDVPKAAGVAQPVVLRAPQLRMANLQPDRYDPLSH
jgi:hypothetical protein